LLRSNILLVAMEMKSTSHCIATDICRISLMLEVPHWVLGFLHRPGMYITTNHEVSFVRWRKRDGYSVGSFRKS
jgi:hypothetical protein